MIIKESFGFTKDQEVFLYTLENDYLKVSVSNFGATLVKLIDKKTNIDIVLGFDDVDGYIMQHGSNIGCTVGRCANRIGKGQFELNGKQYQIPVNNGPNSLHGGIEGFGFKIFDVLELEDGIQFIYHAKDQEEGYPGNLTLNVFYRLKNNQLEYRFNGLADQDTLFNITNHAYFNMDASASMIDQKMTIYTDKVALNDNDGMSKDEIIDVKGTAFDFTEGRMIQDGLKMSHPNMELARGYDHNFVFENLADKVMARLEGKKLVLTVESDLPDIHVYGGNYLDGEVKGKYNHYYKQYAGICFESQYYPNAINYTEFIKPILKKDELKEHYILYTVERKGD